MTQTFARAEVLQDFVKDELKTRRPDLPGAGRARILVLASESTRSQLASALGGRTDFILTTDDSANAAKLGSDPVDLALLDLDQPQWLMALHRLHDLDASLPVIGLFASGSPVVAVQAMRHGVLDAVEVPLRSARIGAAIDAALGGRVLWADMFGGTTTPGGDEPVVGCSAALIEVYRAIRQIASAPNTTVLVRGESGVGKELAARAIHTGSPRANGPFVALNCATLSESLLESELFGHERGAFSGAHKMKPGLFEVADGGTLLLDEIAEMPLPIQAKLLRVLQDKTFFRVGGLQPVHADVRIVASTNRDLESAVADRTFREDLYYRLNVVQVVIPPLRQRPADIAPLARNFLAKFANELGRRLTGFTKHAIDDLCSYSWPGNVRQLKNVIERASILSPGPTIRREDLLFDQTRRRDVADPDSAELLDRTLAEVERAHIARVLELCRGNKSRAARKLGIHRTTLAKKLGDYSIVGSADMSRVA